MATPSKKEWTLYIIEAENGFLYTGITKDLERRFGEHSTSKRSAKFFRRSPPQTIRFAAKGLDRSTALRLEYAVKQLDRAAKQEVILNGSLKTLKRLLKRKDSQK